jgi:phospho-N-acetylmuramoyl-pentapeptide-transferase
VIFYFIRWLEQLGFTISPGICDPIIRMLLACITPLFMWFWLGERFIKKLYELKIGQKIRMEECPMLGQLHEKKKDTPTMGGALILSALLISSIIWMDSSSLYTYVLLVCTLSVGFIGGIDDFLKLKWKNIKGLSASRKLLGQILVGIVLSSTLLVPWISDHLPIQKPWAINPLQCSHKEGVTSYPVTVIKSNSATFDIEKSNPCFCSLSLSDLHQQLTLPFTQKSFLIGSGLVANLLITAFYCFVVCASSNAVNLTDGLDGLATGITILSAACLTLVAFLSDHLQFCNNFNWLYIHGSSEIAVFLMALIGSCLGFLWFNSYPAQVFMGDTGSLGLGAALGVAAILIRRELFFALSSGVLVLEALSVILQVWSFRRRKKRIFLCSPLHHHFEYKGWPETKVVIRFWILGLLFSGVALITLWI